MSANTKTRKEAKTKTTNARAFRTFREMFTLTGTPEMDGAACWIVGLKESGELYALAATEHQARQAVLELLVESVAKLGPKPLMEKAQDEYRKMDSKP